MKFWRLWRSKTGLSSEGQTTVRKSYEKHKHFYNECVAEVIDSCQEHRIDYHIEEKTITEE